MDAPWQYSILHNSCGRQQFNVESRQRPCELRRLTRPILPLLSGKSEG